MATLIEDMKTGKPILDTPYLKDLEECGFVVPVAGYAIITDDAIEEYLLSELNKRFRFPRREHGFHRKDHIAQVSIETFTDWFALAWTETPLSHAQFCPPPHVLKSIKEAKKDFDEIRIVTVEEVDDPLVVGYNKHDSNRYLIDWWDKDIDPTELVK
jgi:hypothetical protein